VQASDFSILTIALVTFLTVTRTAYLPDASTTHKVLICMSVWIVPLTTATVATTMGAMTPVSGNWCWISSNRSELRYVLTHGWRIGIIFFTAGIYIYIWWYMNRHFRSMVSTITSDLSEATQKPRHRHRGFRKVKDKGEQQETDTEMTVMSKSEELPPNADDWKVSPPKMAYVVYNPDPVDVERGDEISSGPAVYPGYDSKDFYNHYRGNDYLQSPALQPPAAWRQSEIAPRPQSGMAPKPLSNGPVTLDTVASEFPHRKKSRQTEREIKRMLLLNAYPIMYVLLWIPGLTNRFLEATGHASESRVLAALQASSQFVGLANALTYGFNRALRGKAKMWWREKRGKS
jgi:hypothetical protein